MDNRLDFYNYVKKYVVDLTDDDMILILSHNKKDSDCFAAIAGDWEILSAMLSTDGYITDTEDDKFNNIRKILINSVFNICNKDKIVGEKFYKELKQIYKNKKPINGLETFRVEFNEKQQAFHHCYIHQCQFESPNTNGWRTVAEICTDDKFKQFESFLNRNGVLKYTIETVKKEYKDFESFICNLKEYKFEISR